MLHVVNAFDCIVVNVLAYLGWINCIGVGCIFPFVQVFHVTAGATLVKLFLVCKLGPVRGWFGNEVTSIE